MNFISIEDGIIRVHDVKGMIKDMKETEDILYGYNEVVPLYIKDGYYTYPDSIYDYCVDKLNLEHGIEIDTENRYISR